MGVVISLFVILISMQACGADDPSETKPEEEEVPDEETEPELTIDPNKTFVHLGMLHTQVDFDRIKLKVTAQESPWIDGWNKLIANSHASLSYNPSPTVKLIRGGSSTEEPEADNYSRAMNDAAAAYQCAIRWKISGEEAYADKAIEILNAWASTCEVISGNSNVALASGIYGYEFANAAEIMRDYECWSTTDFEAFKQWMRDVFYSVSYNFLETHWGTCDSHYWANWDLANLANVMAVGILCDDATLYNYSLDYLMNGVGNGNLTKCINYIHTKSFNDDIDLGQIQESGRDQGHTLLNIGLLGVICQMAYNQGDDLFAYDDNRVLKGAEYVAKYNFANLSVPFTEYTRYYKDAWSVCGGVETHTEVNESGKGGFRPIWELMYHHYVIKKGITARYVSMAARMHRVEGGGGDYGSNSGGFDVLGLGTLMYSLE
ncbi:alginate lyase family protein [Plebeiibacterium sediminum]|uniref:Alginate lyase family protein n=1 Tax=Plebeiibacterium sediminum TaxID=2992112 RepID=A0AAE3M656_9BACT|nr:alginate lyase family protein [Plebeiobacterium sediminum]MCW3787662.1 alginate lyase family protein [Plebeiobacterium sediminum]